MTQIFVTILSILGIVTTISLLTFTALAVVYTIEQHFGRWDDSDTEQHEDEAINLANGNTQGERK